MMINMEDPVRTLTNNGIKKFLLRIDLIPIEGFDFTIIVNRIAQLFDRTEKRLIEGYMIDLTSGGNPSSKKTQDYDYVLVSERNNISLTFSKIQNGFWLESSVYKDSSIYKPILSAIVEAFSQLQPSIISTRIGMRFINEFKCEKLNDIKKLLKKENANIVIKLLSEKNLSRSLAYQEYNEDGEKTRLQYGIVNRFYPAVISSYDLVIDIDSYFDLQTGFIEWEEKIATLNHTDYKYFIKVLNEKYLEKLK